VIWRVSPPHNVADLSESVIANSFAATLRGGGHAPPRERLPNETRMRSCFTHWSPYHGRQLFRYGRLICGNCDTAFTI
jgi:hypothetical protein